MSAVQTALFGLGKIGATYALDPVMAEQVQYASHLQVIEAHPGFEIAYGIDPSDETRQLVGEHWPHVKTAATMEDIEGFENVEFAVLATPPHVRTEIIDALPNLKAVFVEKPLAVDFEHSQAFLDKCCARGIDVQVNFWRRGDRFFNALARGELHKHIGDPQAVFGVYGNGLHNNAAHVIDFVDMLFGNIVSASANGLQNTRAANPISGDVDVGFSLVTESGLTASFLPVNFDHYREISFDFWGTTGRMEMLMESAEIRVSPVAPHRGEAGSHEIACDRYDVLQTEVGTALWEMYENISDAMNTGVDLWSTGEKALKCEKVLAAILTSAQTGCVESVA